MNSRIEVEIGIAVGIVAAADVGKRLVSYLRALVVGVHFHLHQWRPA